MAVKEKIGDNVVLCCYEKPGDFCHRHILIKWLGEGQELSWLKFKIDLESFLARPDFVTVL